MSHQVTEGPLILLAIEFYALQIFYEHGGCLYGLVNNGKKETNSASSLCI